MLISRRKLEGYDSEVNHGHLIIHACIHVCVHVCIHVCIHVCLLSKSQMWLSEPGKDHCLKYILWYVLM